MVRDTGKTLNDPQQPPDNACLFLDVDGTLIDLAPTPDAVVVPAGLVQALTQAERFFGGALALVSGRSIADLDQLFSPKVLIASGVHGAEVRASHDPGGSRPKASPLPAGLWDALARVLQAFPGTLTENKAFSYAIHYRAVPDVGPRLRAALGRLLSEHDELGLQILPGHCVFELKRPGIDKGVSIRTLMENGPFAGRIPIFIGDDVTDAHGFAVVKEFGGWAYAVGQAFPDIDGIFSGPSAVRDWLSRIGERVATAA